MALTFANSIKQIYQQNIKLQDLLNIIEFTESEAGLNLTLYPVQRFLLKVFYALPLTTTLTNQIIIKDTFNEHVIHSFDSEIDFFNFLYEQKRINFSYQEFIFNNSTLNEIVFVCGRRASKTTLTSIIVCYTLYILLSIPDAHKYFNVLRTDPISVSIVSNSLAGATRTFNAISDLITNSKFFTRYVGGTRYDTGLWLKTESFKQEEDNGVSHSNLGNILIKSQAATANVRGASNIVIVLDELAHFRDSATKSHKDKYLDETIYEALYPSIIGFIDPNTNKGVGKSFIMSSPNGKRGALYNFYLKSFNDPSMLMINTPSHWINNKISSNDLIKLYNKSEYSFKQEIMAEFIDRQSNWISDINRLYATFNINNNNVNYASGDYIYYAGFDLGLTYDRSVLAIVRYQDHRLTSHICERPELESLLCQDDKGFFIVEYVAIWEADLQTGAVNVPLMLDEMNTTFCRFNIKHGTYDQFSAELFSRELEKYPKLLTLRNEPATRQNNSNRAFMMKRLINEGRLSLPNLELLKDEFLSLQEEVLSQGEIKVHNPQGHDDIYSAISRAIECAYKATKELPPKSIARVSFNKNFRNINIQTGNRSRDRMLNGRVFQ